MTRPEESTRHLLSRWHGGDRAALDALIERDLPWVHEHVRKRLGRLLRDKGESLDYVQEAMVDVLRYAPRFVTGSRAQFRELLARIIENVLRDKHDWYTARRRAIQRERPLPSGSVLDLDSGHEPVPRPSQEAMRHEREAWVRLALELLDPEDRRVVVLRQWDELSFAEIGSRTGVSEDAARMRFHRALPKLAKLVDDLQGGHSPPDRAR